MGLLLFFFIRLGIGILPVYFPWDWVVQPLLMIFLFCVSKKKICCIFLNEKDFVAGKI